MTLNIEELRKKAQAQAAKAQLQFPTSNTLFPFSSLKVGDSIRIRFIDDGEQNDVFWRERRARAIPFNSVRQADGTIVNNKCWVDVPAFNLKYNEILMSNLPENYLYKSEDDVINARIKSFWDMGDEGKALYSKYGRKKTYIFQGFVRSGDFDKNKLYRFVFTEELLTLIKSFLTNNEIEVVPTDIHNGLDFILNVTSKIANINGKPQEVKDYSTSTWSRKNSPLTEEELEALNVTHPYILKDFIFARPDAEKEKVMLEMFDASMNNEPYDVVKWGHVFKPNNIFFDAQGKVKDIKGNNKSSELPQANTTQFVQQPMVQQPVQQFVQQPVQQFVQQPMVQQESQQTLTAPQIINQNSQTVTGQSPQDVINNLMSRFNVQQ